MHKLPIPNSLDLDRENPGFPVSADIIEDTFFDYRKHGTYPATGGYFDQDTHIIEAFKMMGDMVEWHKLNETKRGNLPKMQSHANRRKHLKGKGKP